MQYGELTVVKMNQDFAQKLSVKYRDTALIFALKIIQKSLLLSKRRVRLYFLKS